MNDFKEDFKGLTNDFDRLSRSRDKLSKEPIELMPSAVLTSQDQRALELAVKELTESIFGMSLIDFSGDTPCVSLIFDYCSPEDKDFYELRRLMSEVYQAAGHRYQYKGIIALDLTPWLSHAQEEHFAELLSYLEDNTHSWYQIFTINSDDSDSISALVSEISRYRPVKTISLGFPSMEEAFYHIKLSLTKNHLSIRAAEQMQLKAILTSIEDRNGSFDLKTLSLLTEDLSFFMLTKGEGRKLITSELMEEYKSSSELLSHLLYKRKELTNKAIGLINEEATIHE